MALRIGNAPVSFGAWSLDAARGPGVPPPERVLEALAAAGYDGTELGPVGYFGDGTSIAAHGLVLSGGYVPIPFGDGFGPLDETLDLFERVEPTARPILADDGDASQPLDFDDVARAVAHVRTRGFEPTFHHHMGTRVETEADIERLLDRVDVPLLLDSGHLLAAGSDPVDAFRRWRDRIDYVHVKDVALQVLRDAPDWPAAWRSGVFCELGTGDLDVRAFLAELDGFHGWVVVEQDWVAGPGDDPEQQIAAQARNRRWLP